MNDDVEPPQPVTKHAQSSGSTQSGAIAVLFGIQLTMSTADWMLIVYFQIQVFHATSSALSIMLLVLCELVPMLVIGPVGGQMADRHEARQILLISSSVKLLMTCMLLVGSLRVNTPFLYVTAALAAALGRFFAPTTAALLPRLTPATLLSRANAIMMAMRTAGMAGGTILAGTTTTVSASMTPIVIMTLIGVSLSLSCRLPKTPLPASRRKENQTLTFSRPFLKEHLGKLGLPLVSSIQVMLALGAFEVLALLYVTKVLHEPTENVGFLFGAYGAGMLLGLILAATRTAQKHASGTLWACMFIMPSAIGSLVVVDDMMLAMVSVALAGASEAIVMAVALLRLYQLTPPMRHGHMIAILDTLSGSAFLVGVLVFGAIADKIMIDLLLQALAAALFSLPILILLPACRLRVSSRLAHRGENTRSQEDSNS